MTNTTITQLKNALAKLQAKLARYNGKVTRFVRARVAWLLVEIDRLAYQIQLLDVKKSEPIKNSQAIQRLLRLGNLRPKAWFLDTDEEGDTPKRVYFKNTLAIIDGGQSSNQSIWWDRDTGLGCSAYFNNRQRAIIEERVKKLLGI